MQMILPCLLLFSQWSHSNLINNVADVINNALSNINEWLNINKLPLNIGKTKYIVQTMTNKKVNQAQIK